MSDSDFDFDDCVGIANRPLKDFDGFVKGKLVSIDIKNVEFKKPRSKNDFEDDIVQKVFVFSFLIEGKTEDIKMSRMTGTKINTEIKHVKGKGRGSKQEEEYNALTETCLKLGLFDIKDVKEENNQVLIDSLKKSTKEITPDNPIKIKTKLETSESSDFENINIRTIELI